MRQWWEKFPLWGRNLRQTTTLSGRPSALTGWVEFKERRVWILLLKYNCLISKPFCTGGITAKKSDRVRGQELWRAMTNTTTSRLYFAERMLRPSSAAFISFPVHLREYHSFSLLAPKQVVSTIWINLSCLHPFWFSDFFLLMFPRSQQLIWYKQHYHRQSLSFWKDDLSR